MEIALFLIVNPNLNEVEVYCIGANSQITILLLVAIFFFVVVVVVASSGNCFSPFLCNNPSGIVYNTMFSYTQCKSHRSNKCWQQDCQVGIFMPTFSIWHIVKWLAVKKKINCWHFSLKSQQEIFIANQFKICQI